MPHDGKYGGNSGRVPLAAIILSAKPRQKGNGGEPMGRGDYPMGRKRETEASSEDYGELAAAEEAVEAAKAGDAEGFAKAMKAFVRICLRKYGPGKENPGSEREKMEY